MKSKGFTPSLENGVGVSKGKQFGDNLKNGLFSKIFERCQHHPRTTPFFSAGFTPSLENGVAVFGGIYQQQQFHNEFFI